MTIHGSGKVRWSCTKFSSVTTGYSLDHLLSLVRLLLLYMFDNGRQVRYNVETVWRRKDKDCVLVYNERVNLRIMGSDVTVTTIKIVLHTLYSFL